jgi:hypothetical protein
MKKEMEKREPAGTDNARMRARMGRGRDSTGRPDETGIRRGEQGNITPPSDADTDDGQPSQQTSTAGDMSGQV